MPEVSPPSPAYRDWEATLRAAEIAGQQWGVIGWGQLRACGVSSSAATRWRAGGRLHVIHRRVYALGHPSIPIEGRLVAALLFAGADAVLSHRTAAWWWRLLPDEPVQVEVSNTSRVRCTPGVIVHHPRQLQSERHRRFPVTTVARTLLDLAATEPLNTLRYALANGDYHRVVSRSEIEAGLGQGRPGSAKLRQAIRTHEPRLARSASKLERDFLHVCEAYDIPLPELNVEVEGFRVDAVWRHQRVVVELDGEGNHSTPAQIKRDRGRDLHLRAAGYVVLRYTWEQVKFEAPKVAADVRRVLSFPAPSAGPGSR